MIDQVEEDADVLAAVIAAFDRAGGLDADTAFLLLPYTGATEDPALRRAAMDALARMGAREAAAALDRVTLDTLERAR